VPASFDFGPFAQILRTLMPRVRGVYLYAPNADLLWSSEGADYSDLRPPIEELLAQASHAADPVRGGFRRMIDETPAYCFPLRDTHGVVLAALAVLFRPPTRDGELPPFDIVERTLAPVLTLAAREFEHQRLRVDGSPATAPETSAAGTTSAPPVSTGATTTVAALGESVRLMTASGDPEVADTQELQWLLDLAHIDAPAEPGADVLQALLDAFAMRSDCDVALLHVPGRQLERSLARIAIPAVELEGLRTLVARHLFRVAQLQQKTLIVNKVRETGAGGLVPYRILCVPVLRRGQSIGVVVAFNRAAGRAFELRDARMLERLAPRLQEVLDVRFDDATGLATRHAFEEHAAVALQRRPGLPRCVVYADVDRVHVVNDLFGFAAGDEVLREVGLAWREVPMPAGSCAARISGDRFVALLEDCSPARAAAWAEATRDAIECRRPPARCEGVRLSASFGVAPVEGALDHALVAAQTACKAAKERGRNRVEVFAANDPSLVQRHDELRIYRELNDAFEQTRFKLYAQPIVPLWDPTRPTRYEIFVRMIDAQGEAVAPDRFLQTAIRFQLMARLDRWVVEDAVRTLAPHAAALAALDATFFVNVSEASLAAGDFADWLQAQLRAAHLPAAQLGVEVRESAAITHLAEVEAFVAAVAGFGCPTAVDDFGTGLSSLAYLKTLTVGALKIDGVFIRDLLTNPRSESMVRAMLQIARQLEVETVAESIESPEIASHLAALGVTYGQGYAFAPPRPLEDVLAEALQKAQARATLVAAADGEAAQVH
jgi:diguanylate cyclase (GGDEF)-like protein